MTRADAKERRGKPQPGKDGQDEQDLQDKIWGRLLCTISLALAFIFQSLVAEVQQKA
ncbi:MAG: hypothetical protein ACLQVY_29370 [Limisphaerales bacterium]